MLCEMFLDADGLEPLGQMLERLPNGSLPNSAFRTRLLALLRSLPVTQENLEHTKVDKILRNLIKSGEELPQNLSVIEAIKQKWIRTKLNLTIDYKNLEHEESSSLTHHLAKRASPAPSKKTQFFDTSKIEATQMRRAKVYHEYTERPKSYGDKFTSEVSGSDVSKHLLKLKRGKI